VRPNKNKQLKAGLTKAQPLTRVWHYGGWTLLASAAVRYCASARAERNAIWLFVVVFIINFSISSGSGQTEFYFPTCTKP
jgi:hypothetical protein